MKYEVEVREDGLVRVNGCPFPSLAEGAEFLHSAVYAVVIEWAAHSHALSLAEVSWAERNFRAAVVWWMAHGWSRDRAIEILLDEAEDEAYAEEEARQFTPVPFGSAWYRREAWR